MNIYQCSQKKMKKFIKAFRKTEYGRTVFCLAYSVPIIGLMLLLITMFSLIIWKWCWYFFFLYNKKVIPELSSQTTVRIM